MAWTPQWDDGDFQIWLYVPAAEDEIVDLYRAAPLLMPEWLEHRAGRDIYVGLAENGVLVSAYSWALPRVEADSVVASVIKSARDRLVKGSVAEPNVEDRFVQAFKGLMERNLSACQ